MTIAEGDDATRRFEDLYRTRYRSVLGYFRRCGVAEPEAADLTQDAFLRLLERMDQVRKEDPWPLLQWIARTILLNWLRGRNTLKRGVKLVDLDDPDFRHDLPAPPGPDYAEVEETAQRRKSLFCAIARLPQSQQQALRLWLADFEYEAIARILGISLDAVRSRLRDARRQLRARLGDEALPEDEQ